MTKLLGILAITFGITAWGALSLHAEGKKSETLNPDKVPAAVKATIEKEVPKSILLKIRYRADSSKAFYEAQYLADGKEVELKIAEDGKLLGKEVEDAEGPKSDDGEEKVALDKLPAAVKSALEKEAVGATILDVEMERKKGGDTEYEARVSKAGSERVIKISSEGKILKEERKTK